MKLSLSRRSFWRLAGSAGMAGAALGRSRAEAMPGSSPLDLVSEQGRLRAFMKVYTSVAKTRVWYWYTGVIDASPVGGPVAPMVGVDTLIRRDVTPTPGGRFEMEMFEGSYFHPVDDSLPLERMINPLNGREVAPFHYREGPYQVGYDGRGLYNPDTQEAITGAPPFVVQFRQAEDQLWFSRDNYIDIPHPFSMVDWPLESSGPRQTTGSFATHFANRAEVADPDVSTARSAFHYEAFMDWLPWMLMGQTPGRMVWRAYGLKLMSIEDLPALARAGFMATHPRLFRDRPWNDVGNMSIDYMQSRKPAQR